MSNLIDTLNIADFKNLRWGVRVPPFVEARLAIHRFEAAESDGFVQVDDHYRYLLGAVDSQRLGSCVMQASTELAEYWINKTFSAGVCFDQDTIDELYMMARMDNYHNAKDEGLELPMGVQELINAGVFPPDTVIERVGMSWKEHNEALIKSPMVIGQSVHEGFSPKNLHPENGAVAETFDTNLMPFTNCHAMLLTGSNLHNNTKLAVLRNPWGSCGQMGDGIICETIDHLLRWSIDFPVQVRLGPLWADWRGWEKWVKSI